MDRFEIGAAGALLSGLDLSSTELELLRLRASRYARQEEAVTRNQSDAVVFERGDARYAVLVTDLREIRPLRRPCLVPGASRVVPMVFYYRGEILSAHDLGSFLTDRELTATPPWVLVLEHQSERIGLLADSITDITAVPTDRLHALPVTFGTGGEGFYGVLDGGVLLIHPARLLANPKFSSAF